MKPGLLSSLSALAMSTAQAGASRAPRSFQFARPRPSAPGSRGGRRVAVLQGLLALAACAALTSSLSAAQMIAVNFQGRLEDNSNLGTSPLTSDENAGAVPQGNWNNVDDSTYTPNAEKGTTPALVDSTGAASSVTLTFNANDSWSNDTDPFSIVSPNARMMNGIIKEQGVGSSSTFTFNNVPEGQYDVYVYLTMNGDGVRADITDQDHTQTYYAIEQHQFIDTDTLKQITSTDPTAPELGNYVKLSNLGTYGRGKIGFFAKYVANGDGNGISGIQLVNIGAAVANTNKIEITAQPSSQTAIEGGTASFSVAAAGPVFSIQWYKGSTAIPNATNLTFTTPVLTSTDNGTTYYVALSNNVSSVQSSVVTLGVVENKFVTGVLKYEYFPNQNKAAVEGGTAGLATSTGPTVGSDRSGYVTSWDSGVNFAETYANRFSGYFLPPKDGNYVFFIASDDAGDLYLSPDENPANKKLIAQESGWSNPHMWATVGGGSNANDKRSDTFANSEWTPANLITLKKGSKYYIEGVHEEGNGGDTFSVTYKLDTDPDPAEGSATLLTGDVIGSFVPQVMTVSPGNVGFNALTFTISDVGPSVLDPASVKVTFDGQTIVPVVSPKTTNGVTAFSYTYPSRLIPGSTHTYTIDAKDAGGNPANQAGSITLPLPWFPAGDLPGPAPLDKKWVSRFIFNRTDTNTFAVITLDSLAKALTNVIDSVRPDFNGTVVDVTNDVVDWAGTTFFMTKNNPYPDEVLNGIGWSGDNFVNLNVGHIVVPEEGDYTFGMHTDDGCAIRIVGGEAISVSGGGQIDLASPDTAGYPGTTGDSNTRVVYHLKKGVYRVEFVWYEDGSGDGGELYAAKGAFVNDADTSNWRLVGDSTPSETLTLLGVDDKGWTLTASDPFDVGVGVPLMTWADGDLALSTSGGAAKEYDVLNVGDPDTNPGVLAFPKDRPGKDDDDYAMNATATLVVPADGDYLIGFDSDDGARVQIVGQTFDTIIENLTQVSYISGDSVICDITTGDSGTTATINLKQGTYQIVAGEFEHGGGSFLRVSGASMPTGTVNANQIPALAKGAAGNTFTTIQALQLTSAPTGIDNGGSGGNGAKITVTRAGSTLTINWTPTGGTLQSTTALSGSSTVWADEGTANPAQITVPATGVKFYRVKQ